MHQSYRLPHDTNGRIPNNTTNNNVSPAFTDGPLVSGAVDERGKPCIKGSPGRCSNNISEIVLPLSLVIHGIQDGLSLGLVTLA